MADSHWRWLYNVYGAPTPMIRLGNFQAGATAEVEDGELIYLTGGNWIPVAADQDLSAGVGAFAAKKIKNGDRAGFYPIIVPRPGDVFRMRLQTAAGSALGTAVYPSSTGYSEYVHTSGSNILGNIADGPHIPEQGSLSVDGSPDAGTTLRSQNRVGISIQASNSYYSQLFTA